MPRNVKSNITGNPKTTPNLKNYYKYLESSRAIKYLDNEYLRFTQPADLNDPFECLPKRDIEIQFLKFFQTKSNAKSTSVSNKLIQHGVNKFAEAIEKKSENNLADRFYNGQFENINNTIGILSLSENWNNTLMWSHYTKSHKGVCIGFDANHDFFKDKIEGEEKYRYVKSVKYSKSRVKFPKSEKEQNLISKNLLTKSLDWNYEQEVRVISTLNQADEITDKKPYNIHLFKVPLSAISEVILGVNISVEDKKIFQSRFATLNVEIFQSEISKTKFNMERNKYCW